MKLKTMHKSPAFNHKLGNVMFFGLLFIIVITAYCVSNFSLGREEVATQIVAVVEDDAKLLTDEMYIFQLFNDSENYYIDLPETVNGKLVKNFIFYTEKVNEEISNPESISEMQEESNINEISEINSEIENKEVSKIIEETPVEEDVFATEVEMIKSEKKPGDRLYITQEELEAESINLIADYDFKALNGEIVYNKVIKYEINDTVVTATGYMPVDSKLNVEEVDLQATQDKINNKTAENVDLTYAYDITILSNELEYEPYEIGENVKVSIDMKEKTDDINVWHIDEKEEVEKLEVNKVESVASFTTDSFSIYGVQLLSALAPTNSETDSGVVSDQVIVNDLDADWYYYNGLNYTTDISGEKQNIYNQENLVKVTINYYAHANVPTPASDMIGYISLDSNERQKLCTYYKYYPVINNSIKIDLIDNPFMDKPTGYGFGGWVAASGTVSTNSYNKSQTLTLPVTEYTNSIPNDITANVYANWQQATVVYVNNEIGYDDTNTGLTAASPFCTFGKAMQYLEQNSPSANVDNRELNIIVMSGDMEDSFNYTTPFTDVVAPYSSYEYSSSTTFESGGTYALSSTNAFTYNFLTENGTSTTRTTVSNNSSGFSDSALWIITASGSGYTIQNASTGYYLSNNNTTLTLSTTPKEWSYNTSRRFYTTVSGSTRSYYLRYTNNSWTMGTSTSGSSMYFTTVTSEVVNREKGTTSGNSYYTSSNNIAFTLTSLYNHIDYRDTAVWNLTSTTQAYHNIDLYNDFQMDFVNIKANGYTAMSSTTISTSYPDFVGNCYNVRIGRGMYPLTNTSSDASTFQIVQGGATSSITTGSTSNDDYTYKLVVESGRYSSLQGYHNSGITSTSTYYGEIDITFGNDFDRVNGNDINLCTYYRSTTNSGSGQHIRNDINDAVFVLNVKSGTFGMDYFESNPTSDDRAYSGIYLGGYGTSASTSTRDIGTRIMKVQGGVIANIIGGLKVYTSNTTTNTKIYVTGGRVENIVGGAGVTTTYGNRYIQVTGGTVRYSISGGSNGIHANTTSVGSNNGELSGNSLVYVGGTAQIGTEETLGTTLYEVGAGCVLGAGNGNSTYKTTSGKVLSSHVIVNDDAHILNRVYGGGNYGTSGSSSVPTFAKVDILGGTIENVYCGANNNNIYGYTALNIKDGVIRGAAYGGSNTEGTITQTSTVNITGGTLGVNTNTPSKGVVFAGGYGEDTVVTGNATLNILDTDNNVYIYGSSYGGSSLGDVGGNTIVNVSDLPLSQDDPNTANSITIINGYVFAGGQGNATISADIFGDSILTIDGGTYKKTIPTEINRDVSVFGGNDVNGNTDGTITVNIGGEYITNVANVYGGGNKAEISASVEAVNVNLLDYANVTNAFNGGKEASLLGTANLVNPTRKIIVNGNGVIVDNVFGGSDSSGTVTESNVYLELGTVKNVYGGNNIGGETSNAKVYINGGAVTEAVHGAGYGTNATTSATNVSLQGGIVQDVFGGGESAGAGTTSTTLSGTQVIQNIYGGSNQNGDVANAYVSINSGSVKDVFGGNNAGGTTGNTNVNINSATVRNVYGGGNEAETTGNTTVKLTNAHISKMQELVGDSYVDVGGDAFGGGNGATAIVRGNNTIIVEGTTQIDENLFGGGNEAETGTLGGPYSIATVYLVGGTIGQDVYGAANRSTVYGETITKVGYEAVNDNSLVKGNISIAGTVFGGGKSNIAGSENYDYTFESVKGNKPDYRNAGDVRMDIDASGYDDGQYTFNIGESIFASGNAAKITGNGYINLSNYGNVSTPKLNVSIQRVTELTIDNSYIWLSGTTDRTNQISAAIYTLNRIGTLNVKNNTTLYLTNSVNLVENIYSKDASDSLETVNTTVQSGNQGELIYKVSQNSVNNRIYIQQGKNIILKDELGNDGEIHGMTFLGVFKGTVNMSFGIYNINYNTGNTIATADTEIFNKNSYVQAKRYSNHDINVDGYFTNYDISGVIDKRTINPVLEDQHYQWVIGEISDDIFYENIELIATKYSTTGAYVLYLTGLNHANTTIQIMDFDVSDLKQGVSFVEPGTIPNISLNGQSNSVFGLTMTAGNSGWQTTGTTTFKTADQTHQQAYSTGATQYLTDNSSTTPTVSLYLAHSKNISSNEPLGTVTVHLQASYIDENEEYIIKDAYIVMSVAVNNTSSITAEYYEGTINPGEKYEMQPSTTTNITNDSVFSTYYSVFLGDYSDNVTHYDNYQGYYHLLKSSFVYPENTKITMIDKSSTAIKYYYYVVTATDEANNVTSYPLTDFIAMGSSNDYYNLDSSYYNSQLDLVYEEFIFQVDFEDATISDNKLQENLILELRDIGDDKLVLSVNTEQYPMAYSIYTDKNADANINLTLDKETIYVGEQVTLNAETTYQYQVVDSVMVYDTHFFEDAEGIRISVLDGSSPLTYSQLVGMSYTIDGVNYFPGDDGSVRIKVADAVSNIEKNIIMNTENSVIETGSYILRVETFGSIDGIYFSTPMATATANIQIVSTNYGLSADLADTSMIIDKETGLNQNNDNVLNFTVGYSGTFLSPKIYVSLHRRDYSTVHSLDYSLVNLQSYVSTSLETTVRENEYLVSNAPTESQQFVLNLNNNLTTGTYKIKFILYDGTKYIGEVYKQIIIR